MLSLVKVLKTNREAVSIHNVTQLNVLGHSLIVMQQKSDGEFKEHKFFLNQLKYIHVEV